MQTLTKAKLAERLHERLGLFNRRDAVEIVNMVLDEIKCSLEDNDTVHLSGFGNFHLLDKNERVGRNLHTGEQASVSARRVVSFRAGEKLKRWLATAPKGRDD